MTLQISRELNQASHALDKHSEMNEFLFVQEVCGRLMVTYRWLSWEEYKANSKN